jgi:hypothetical protein
MSEHEQGAHAVLSPSSSERWLSCPASVRVAESLPEPPESPYAAEGTAAHAVAEAWARYELLNGDAPDLTILDPSPEMAEHAEGYVALLRERLERYPNSVLMLEQKLPTGVPQSWGTSDAVIVSPQHVEIIDLKYGMGVRVEAEGNSQLRLYAVGGLEAFGSLLGEVTEVFMTVYQPRLEHTDTAVMTAADLLAWRDSIIPTAEEALGPDAHFGPSEDACRFCPARGQCVAQMEWATKRDFGSPDLLSPALLAEALTAVPAVEQWCKDVRETALDLAYNKGVELPGFKVVMSGGRRSITDPEGAIEWLSMAGYERDQVTETKVKGIGELERLLGKDRFALQMAPYVSTSEGKPAVVSEDDKRPAINPNTGAVNEFSENREGEQS